MPAAAHVPAAAGLWASPRLFDRFRVGMYSAFLLWNWLLYAYGPAVQLLGADLSFSAAAIGLHAVALAAGTALAGVILPVTVSTFGRRGALICGATMVAVGAVGLTALSDLPGTMTATVILALGGDLAIAAAQAGLVVHHTLNSAASVSTANGLGTLVALFGSLLIGASVAVGWGWRPVVLVTVPIAVAVSVYWLRMPALPAPFALGVLAGFAGVHTAFLLVPALAAAGLIATRLGARQMQRSPAPVA